MPSERQLSICTAFGLWAAAIAAAALYASWHGYSGRQAVFTLCLLAFFLAAQLFFAAGDLGERLARRAGSQAGVLIATAPFLAYLIYLPGTNTFTGHRVILAAVYVFVPVLLAISAGAAPAGSWQDYLAILAIFLPIKMRALAGLWPAMPPVLGYMETTLFAVTLALGTFLFVRQFNGVGYNIFWGRNAAIAVLVNFGLLAVIVIPLGVALHFIRFDPSQANWRALPGDAISIFLLAAWPEELLFRGLLQNALTRTFSNENGGWFAASVIFGLSHIANNGVFPNWRYALLATIAGIFYGRTWRKTNSIFTSAIVHGLVDTIWHLLFRTL